MDRIPIKWQSSTGLGTAIGLLSLIYHVKKPIEWRIPRHEAIFVNTLLMPLITSLNLDKDLIKFTAVDEPMLHNPVGDVAKMFVPYLSDNAPITKDKRKPFALIAMYGHTEIYKDDHCVIDENIIQSQKTHISRSLWYKYHSMHIYAKIMQVCLGSNYDIITLDKLPIDLEDKIYLMRNFVDFVIGYEGGLTHLAHVLGIPSIILPYNGNRNLDFWTRVLHLDCKTYHIEHINQIIKLTPSKLAEMLSLCNSNLTNNILLQDNVDIFFTPTLDHLLVLNKENILNSIEWHTPWLLNAEKSFILENIKDLHLGGIKPIKIAGDSTKKNPFNAIFQNQLPKPISPAEISSTAAKWGISPPKNAIEILKNRATDPDKVSQWLEKISDPTWQKWKPKSKKHSTKKR